MASSLELVDHTQDLQRWHLPSQQHKGRQPKSPRGVKPCGKPGDDASQTAPEVSLVKLYAK